jgi:hypothetical protein
VSQPAVNFEALQDVPFAIKGGETFIAGHSVKAAWADIQDIFKPHKYGWPMDRDELFELVCDAVDANPGTKMFRVTGLVGEVKED